MHAGKVSSVPWIRPPNKEHIPIVARLFAHIPLTFSVKRVRQDHCLESNLAWQYPYHKFPFFMQSSSDKENDAFD